MLYSAIVCCEHQQRMSLITSRRVTRVPGTSRAARREGCCPPTVSSGCHFEYGRQICQRVDISARWTLSLATAFHIYWFFMAYFLASYWKSANIRPWLRQFSLKIGHLCHWGFFFHFYFIFFFWVFTVELLLVFCSCDHQVIASKCAREMSQGYLWTIASFIGQIQLMHLKMNCYSMALWKSSEFNR